MKVAIIDYGSGNLRSAQKAFERAAKDKNITAEITLTSNPEFVAGADRIVLPGVGAYADCRQGLDLIDGMVDALHQAVIKEGKPFLGICVGMQLMAERGLEKKTTKGLGWIGGDVVRIEPDDDSLKIPQIGWNTLEVRKAHAVLNGIDTGEAGLHAYFVHSYHLICANPDNLIATTNYGGSVTAIVGRDNMMGTQFHPEKSQRLGLALIGNFLKWNP
ncbi:MAG: imidazole glycerol phosphate synthase subunit HisH [Rhizobiaceae bacterium]